jgi:DNA topoisomerase VI subunit B
LAEPVTIAFPLPVALVPVSESSSLPHPNSIAAQAIVKVAARTDFTFSSR